ncbi:MAG: mechanosensitive ion channel family protein [Geminocystis sp.]|nr:mechanosensitive ion channel family protein [Geminocystis sp.]HIK38087.1 mechanosensitive ion channel family protein [Geminocystis sp. M7585_C2015_104]MCS7149055.1 mechanosensitive ion channel family protein [Geminocystis sp.]MCX8077428.1 mechanosensitive ion channel family protein [Geminocystis sp.]MDW8117132.1 mechanosensitive ion channel family protein [Geminocystis sp.]
MFSKIAQNILAAFDKIIITILGYLPSLLSGLVILLLTRYLADWIETLVQRIADRTVKSPSLQILFRKTASVAVWVLGFILALVVVFPSFTVGYFFSTLGIGSVVVGFAFQDILKNFFAGILILSQEPFSIGDEIAVEGYQGLVEHIDIRTTTIRTYQGEKILIPNATLFTNSVLVRTGFDYRRTDIELGLDYNTELEEIQQLLLRVVKSVEGVVDNPPPEVDVVGFGDSAVRLVVRYWTPPQQKTVRRVQTRAIIAIKKALGGASTIVSPSARAIHLDQQEC